MSTNPGLGMTGLQLRFLRKTLGKPVGRRQGHIKRQMKRLAKGNWFK